MKRFKRVKKFKRDSRGVVTVMVTLLLIPAVLISGTAVDLARIHTSRSVLHNANQLAANTVMTQYDAMIKDLYGLYGIMEDDPVLAELLDEYIMVAVFGTGEETAGLGTFQMLGGTPRDSVKNTLTPHPVQHLRNPEVIRRQIEEYMKFRAPTVIMNDLFGKIEQFTKIKNDAEAIKDKLDIDDKFSELGELYEELFLRLRFNDHYLTGGNTKGLEADIFRDINATMGTVNSYFKSMLSNRNTYMNAKRELESLSPPSSGEDSDAYEAYERRKAELEREMADSKSAYNDHDWNIYSAASGLSFRLGGYKGGSGLLGFGGLPNDFYRSTTTGRLDSYISNLGIDSSGKSRLEKLCEEIEKKTEEINGMIRKLETQQLPDCSDQLRGDEESPGIQQAINEIKEWLDMEPKPGTLVGDLNSNKEYIEAFQDWLDDSKIMYGTINSSNSLSGDTSISASLNSLKSSMFSNIEAENDDLEKFAALSTDDIEYVHFYKANPDVTMQAFVEIGDDHALLYAKLYMLYGLADEAGGDASSKKAIQKAISDMTQAAADQLNGIINRPRGGEGPAINKRIPDAAWKQLQHDKDEFEEVLKNNWSNSGNNNKTAIAALAQAIKKFFDIGAHLNNAGNHILLLTYSTEMFSNYTSRYDSDAVSLAGIPFGEDVNYLLDWEMEYLFNGSQSANANLAAVSDLMFMCRFVFNYISTFKLANVNAVLTGVQAAFAWAGPFQLVIRELTRVGLAIAESAVDVMNLRLGKDVELIKLREDEWSVLGFAALKDIALDTAQNAINAAIEYVQNRMLPMLGDLRSYVMGEIDDLKGQMEDTHNKIELIEFVGNKYGMETADPESGVRMSDFSRELIDGFDNAGKNVQDAFDNAMSEETGLKKVQFRPETPPQSESIEDINDAEINKPPPGLPAIKLNYQDYLRIFMLFTNGDTVANRTANLIALNVSHKKAGFDVASGNLIQMSEVFTGFDIRTSMELKMFFLSLPYAQAGLNGVVPPGTLPVTVTDFRGY